MLRRRSVISAILAALAVPPRSAPEWHVTVEHYDIKAVLAVAGPNGFRLQEFCASDEWILVYIDARG